MRGYYLLWYTLLTPTIGLSQTETSPQVQFIFEAEEGMLTSPMAIGTDVEASGQKYIYSSLAESGAAEFTLRTPAGGFNVWVRAKASTPNSGMHDSFYVSFDLERENTWHLAEPTSEWSWGVSERTFHLSSGLHTLRIAGRESLTLIDKIIITTDESFDPSDRVNVTLSWSPPEYNLDGTKVKNLEGFKLYYGLSNRNYTSSLDVGNRTSATINELPIGPAIPLFGHRVLYYD